MKRQSARAMSVAEALAITGGLSAPGKMPRNAYSLPAKSCRLGMVLRHLPRSVCAHSVRSGDDTGFGEWRGRSRSGFAQYLIRAGSMRLRR